MTDVTDFGQKRHCVSFERRMYLEILLRDALNTDDSNL